MADLFRPNQDSEQNFSFDVAVRFYDCSNVVRKGLSVFGLGNEWTTSSDKDLGGNMQDGFGLLDQEL